MKTNSSISKQALLFIIMFLILKISYSQPTVFSWNNRHGNIDYISAAKDQKEQGPCGIFATVAAVEAMVQIYFNTAGSDLNLSESNLYSACGLGEFQPGNALPFFVSTGAVDEYSWPFPTSKVNAPPWEYYVPSPACESYTNYVLKAKIPGWGVSIYTDTSRTIKNDEDLKKAIMDYGPIILMGTGTDQSGNKLGLALHPGGDNVNHSVLITGWNSNGNLNWEIKDSWPGAPASERLVDINFFNYAPDFYWIKPVINDNGTLKYITVKNSSGTDIYSQLTAADSDHDGFYRWGLDANLPTGFTGCDKMDFNDNNKSIICRNGYNVLNAPYIYDTASLAAKYICSSGKYFTLNNFYSLPSGFSIEWYLTPENCFYTSSGSETTAHVVPIPSYIGKKCKIEYKLYYTKNGTATLVNSYKWDFIVNGPNEDLVSISVLDSYGGSAQGSGDYFYLCPNTNYTIYYNNYDNNCTTSNFTWSLPYGWTRNYEYGNYVSINTNDYPYGCLQINASTCCGSDVNIKNVYFSEAYCGEYFMVYPNPANSYIYLDIIKDKFSFEENIPNERCLITVVDRSGITKSKFTFIGFPYKLNTNNLTEGIYFINIQFKNKRSAVRLSVNH